MSNKIEYSFANWCEDNNRMDLIDRWDYDLNNISPSNVSYKSNKKYWFKCPENKHDSQLFNIQYLPAGKQNNLVCKKCNSFAQYIINEFGERFLKEIWAEDNVIDPWSIASKSSKKAIFICENNHSHKYVKEIEKYTNGSRCPYCVNKKITIENSLLNKEKWIFNIWSEKNSITPDQISVKSGKEIWWKCKAEIHEEYKRKAIDAYNYNYECPQCIKNKRIDPRIKDLSGKEFGDLKVIEYDIEKSRSSKQTYWKCVCSCGKIISTYSAALLDGRQKTCGNRSIHCTKENNGNWKGGITPEAIAARTSMQYSKWRYDALKKDHFTCQCCGRNKNINKEVHHIYNFSNHEDKRFDVNNAITLCKECHSVTIKNSFHDIYGTKNNTKEQLEEYINTKRKQLGINIPFDINSYIEGNILM